jgi:DNA-binding NtrC family response regulator
MLFMGDPAGARDRLNESLRLCGGLSLIRLSALDSLAQVAIFESDFKSARTLVGRCGDEIAEHSLPARSWYDLAHQVTRCAYFERLEDWDAVIDIVDEADPELARRQYKALRTTLLCAKARALARLGKTAQADAALATAVRVCPRGAVDPLIVLEASKAVCLGMRGSGAAAGLHFDRSLAASRAIGHRVHTAWIERERAGLLASTVGVPPRQLDVTAAALLLSDVAAVIGAGYSIDLLAQRMAAILQSTTIRDRVTVTSQSGQPYRPEPSATWSAEADGTFRIRLLGSDRLVSIDVRGVQTLDEISLLKSIADLVQAAVNRTADTEVEDDDQNLWPRSTADGGDETVFQSPRMAELVRIAIRLASTDLPILITGETGTGKEVVARLIHEHSRKSGGPFVAFNCSAVPRELVESQLFGHRRGAFTGATDSFAGVVRAAEHGTLFLDEIADLDLSTQPKLLRFLERAEIHPVGEARPHHVPVRVIAATNADLEARAEDGRFRRDLFYRLGVAHLALPPLRERKDEIPALASLFLARYARDCQRSGLHLSDDFIAALLLHDWPGNIRQLANEIRRVVAMAQDGDTLTSAELGHDITRKWNARPTGDPASDGPTVGIRLDQTLAQAVEQLERAFINRAIASTGGRVAEAAELLGLSRKGLFLKRRRRGLIEP